MKTDIESRAHIVVLVDAFYGKAVRDPLLGPVFANTNLPAHMPVMYQFWASMLLGERSYQGNPFHKHMSLAITPAHFDRWLKLFTETVDALFAGERAEEAKTRAQSIAGIFQHKLGF